MSIAWITDAYEHFYDHGWMFLLDAEIDGERLESYLLKRIKVSEMNAKFIECAAAHAWYVMKAIREDNPDKMDEIFEIIKKADFTMPQDWAFHMFDVFYNEDWYHTFEIKTVGGDTLLDLIKKELPAECLDIVNQSHGWEQMYMILRMLCYQDSAKKIWKLMYDNIRDLSINRF